jgi:adenylate kinase family enzyme
MTASYSVPVDAILMLGPTGSGKSPLGDFLTSRGFLGKRAHHLDFGSELRSIVSGVGSSAYTPSEQDFLFGVLEHGLLLENEHFGLAEKIISLFLDRSRFRAGDVLVLNGIPRHEGQAKDIAAIARVHALVVLECSPGSVFCRIGENTGGDRTGRKDDERELIEKKLRIFSDRTTPLVGHYEQVGSRIYRIDINERTTAGSAYHQLSTLAAADPPVALVAEPPQR